MSDFQNPIPTIERPTPIDREVEWDKSKVLISETDAAGTITNYVAPFYDSLLKMERIGGVELSSRFFKNYLAKQGKDYIDFVIDIMSEGQQQTFSSETVSAVDNTPASVIVSDDILNVDDSMNEKRKNFFERLFS